MPPEKLPSKLQQLHDGVYTSLVYRDSQSTHLVTYVNGLTLVSVYPHDTVVHRDLNIYELWGKMLNIALINQWKGI